MCPAPARLATVGDTLARTRGGSDSIYALSLNQQVRVLVALSAHGSNTVPLGRILLVLKCPLIGLLRLDASENCSEKSEVSIYNPGCWQKIKGAVSMLFYILQSAKAYRKCNGLCENFRSH